MKKSTLLSELSYRCGPGEDDSLDAESECQPFSPSPPSYDPPHPTTTTHPSLPPSAGRLF